MERQDLQHLYVDMLRDTLNAERQIVKALPKLIHHAQRSDLKDGLTEHLRITEDQIERLKKVFAEVETTARGKHCPGMEGLLEEGGEITDEIETGETADAALIAACQKVEHYEIAAYGTLVAYANLLGLKNSSGLLDQSLREEKDADEKLSILAESINFEALDGDTAEEVAPRGRKKAARG
jgi:ferritin-like metal-binding protein YciE